MGFLETLKTLIEAKLNIKIQGNTLFKITVVKGVEQTPVTYKEDTQRYVVDLEKLSPKECKQIEYASKDYVENDNILLEEKSSELLQELYRFKKVTNSTLEFFHGIIPPSDFSALRASIFIRKKFQTGNCINDLKRDVIMRFGDRGKNICNLCSAGYFEEFLIPLFNADKGSFEKIYNDLVSSSMLAVFVNSGMNASDIPGEIQKKIEVSKKYGFKFIHIHGIGQKNIKTIKEFIEQNKQSDLFNTEKINYANPEEHILIAELILP